MATPSPILPQPLWALPCAQLAAVVGLMTDIDDTLTRDGAIEPVALDALHALAEAGVPVVCITGRPLGWSEPCARHWPVAAIVAENGGVALVREGGALRVEYAQDAATRAANAPRLRAVAEQILREVPTARLARDSAGRATDIAIDHAEFAHLPPEQVDRVVALMRGAGLRVTVSSIHVNGWLGAHDKWSAAQWMARRLFGRSLDAEVGAWVFVGDSTNDQPLFARIPLAVGVANLRRFAGQLEVWPAYITEGDRGTGFAEVAAALLAARRAAHG